MIGEQIQAVVVLCPQTGCTLVYSNQLEQAILNLTMNAREVWELLPLHAPQ